MIYYRKTLSNSGTKLTAVQVDVKLMHVTKSKSVEIRPDSPLRINYSVKNQSAPADDRGVKNDVF